MGSVAVAQRKGALRELFHFTKEWLGYVLRQLEFVQLDLPPHVVPVVSDELHVSRWGGDDLLSGVSRVVSSGGGAKEDLRDELGGFG